MPDNQDPALQTLVKALGEVADRANRLKEWTQLAPFLRSIDSRLEEITRELRRGLNAEKKQLKEEAVGVLSDLWEKCRNSEFLDLQNLVDGVSHINRPPPADGKAAAEPAVTKLMKELTRLDEEIARALGEQAAPALQKHSSEFHRLVKWHLVYQRARVEAEIGQLCELTLRLRSQLGV
jgi:hypothetical protein